MGFLLDCTAAISCLSLNCWIALMLSRFKAWATSSPGPVEGIVEVGFIFGLSMVGISVDLLAAVWLGAIGMLK